ncbi:MAG: hypothetical protein PF636_04905, partial [Actinomycetota bacterium]|nr:hypothetical protein [Actinomycetota bacterium]
MLLRLQSYLPRLMNQMNRFGPPDHFLYDERESFARNLLFQWHEALMNTTPDVVFFEEPPNSPYNYALYVLCRELRIRTVYLNATSIEGRSLLRECIEQPPLRLGETMQKTPVDHSSAAIPEKLRRAVAALTESQDFTHRYMQDQADYDARQIAAVMPKRPLGALKWLTIKVAHGLNIKKWPLFIRNYRASHIRSTPTRVIRRKLPGIPMGTRVCTVGELNDYKTRARAIKEHLRADYIRRCEEPDYANDHYVYFPLHYRPERTSNPDGGVFYDQIIPLAMISEALPPNWKIYVKEHPSQLGMALEGECGRTTQYY